MLLKDVMLMKVQATLECYKFLAIHKFKRQTQREVGK